jgi:nucleoside-diphosphate-sugar epimerase
MFVVAVAALTCAGLAGAAPAPIVVAKTAIATLAADGAQPHEAQTLRLDSSRAREQLGWRPLWDLERALESIVDWYRAFASGEDMRETTLAQIRAYDAAAVAP